MENDEIVNDNTFLRWFFGLIAVIMLVGPAFVLIDQRNKLEVSATERMYLACLDKLVNPEHKEYVAQLTACKKVAE